MRKIKTTKPQLNNCRVPQKELLQFTAVIFLFSFSLLHFTVCSGGVQQLPSIVARATYFSLSEDLCYLLHCKDDPSGEKGIERWWIWHGKDITEQSHNIGILIEHSLISSHYNCLRYFIGTQPCNHFLDYLLLTPCPFQCVPPALPLLSSSTTNSSPLCSRACSC